MPLKCGIHKCRSRCHRVENHSLTECNQLVEKVCERQHKIKIRCGKEKEGCGKCIDEDKEMERRIKRDLQLEEDRRRREEDYTQKLQAIQDEVEHQRRVNKYEVEEELRKQTLEQQRSELVALKDAEKRLKHQNKLKTEQAAKAAEKSKATTKTQRPVSSKEHEWLDDAQSEWDFLKQYEGARSKPLDDLMEMIGLEEVKQEFLAVKSKVDTALRQGVSMASERFSCSMLGNPGTGETLIITLVWCLGSVMLTAIYRKNYRGSPVRPVSYGALRDPRLLLQRKYWGWASQPRCCGDQEFGRGDSQ